MKTVEACAFSDQPTVPRRLGLPLFLLESLAFLIIAVTTYGVFGPTRTPSSSGGRRWASR
jgi:hypothetical protein